LILLADAASARKEKELFKSQALTTRKIIVLKPFKNDTTKELEHRAGE